MSPTASPYSGFNTSSSGPYSSYTTMLNSHESQMFSGPMRGHNFAEYGVVNNSPPQLGVRDYPIMIPHSPTHLSGNVGSLSGDETGKLDSYPSHLDDKYVNQIGEDKYVPCGLGDDKYVSNLSPKYQDHLSPVKYENDPSMMNGDCSPGRGPPNVIQLSSKDQGGIKMEPNVNQTYATLPPFMN